MKRIWLIAVAVAVGPTISIHATRIPRPKPTPKPIRISFAVGAAVAEAQTPTLTPASGSCCIAHGTAGCDDVTCQNSVCTTDFVCCGLLGSGGTWDFQCTLEAGTLASCLAQGVPADSCDSLTYSDCACAQGTPTPTPTISVTPGGPPTITPLPQYYCCQRDVPVACGPPGVGINCGALTPVPVSVCNGATGLCVPITPMAGQVIVDEDTPTETPVPGTPTRTPTNTRTATVTGTPPSPTPTPTSSRQDCCECPELNCSIPPVNDTCPQGCTLIPNACCNCGGGGEITVTPGPTHTAGGSTAAPRPTSTQTPTRGQ